MINIPSFPIVDTHLHLWDPKLLRYPWLDQNDFLNRPFLLDDYRKACGPIQVERMVFLQCECDPQEYRREVDWVTSLAKKDPRIQGIVPWAPLEKGDRAQAELEGLASNPLIKGVRRIIQFEPDINFCLQRDFIQGVRALPKFKLSFDICIAHQHMANTIEMVRQCPEVLFILDHIGKPNIKDGLLEPWKKEIKSLSSFPNVHCKLSGLATEADFRSWKKEELKPYIDHVVECFGFDRMIYGGDWPVAAQAIAYPQWVETILWALQGTSTDELKKLFRDNAIQFYRLPA